MMASEATTPPSGTGPRTTSNMNPLDVRLVLLSSSALAENLRQLVGATGDQPDPTQVERWMDQIRLQVQRRRSRLLSYIDGDDDEVPGKKQQHQPEDLQTDDHTSSTETSEFSLLSEDELVQAARQEGFRQWQLQGESSLPKIITPPANDKKKSSQQFSLFASLGGGLASFVTWDRVTSSDEPLHLLRTIQHLDDLLPDWEQHVQPYFLQGLLRQQDGFLDLHRIWFDKSRSSTEYRTVQLGLCQNLITAVVQTEEHQKDTLDSRIRLILHMFSDWMLRGLYVHDARVWSMGQTLWGWLTAPDATLMVQSSLIEADPQATWFSAWLAHFSADQTQELLVDAARGGLSSALVSCHRFLSQQEAHVSVEEQQKQYDVCGFWLAVVSSILRSTRVSRFPWDDLVLGEAVAAESASSSSVGSRQMFVLDVYVRFLQRECQREESSSGDMVASICVDAMETILWGCRHNEENDPFPAMVGKVTDLEHRYAQLSSNSNGNKKRVHRLLRGVLARLQGQ